jgi:hypothetical protein
MLESNTITPAMGRCTRVHTASRSVPQSPTDRTWQAEVRDEVTQTTSQDRQNDTTAVDKKTPTQSSTRNMAGLRSLQQPLIRKESV